MKSQASEYVDTARRERALISDTQELEINASGTGEGGGKYAQQPSQRHATHEQVRDAVVKPLTATPWRIDTWKVKALDSRKLPI